MRRAPALIAAILSVVLIAALAGALSSRDDLRAELAAVRERLDETYDELAGTRAAHRTVLHELDDSAAEVKRFRRRAQTSASRASSSQLALRRLRGVDGALARGHEVVDTRWLHGEGYDLVAVTWGDRDDTRSGVYVWRAGETSIELVYVVEPVVDFDPPGEAYVLAGPPGAETKYRSDAWVQWAGIADTGDATGDGLPDLALSESGSGSGGCGKVRLLQNLGGSLRQTYEHEDCDHGIEIDNAYLVLVTAARPKGCENIHGCGSRRTWMRWSGTEWVVEKVTRDLF